MTANFVYFVNVVMAQQIEWDLRKMVEQDNTGFRKQTKYLIVKNIYLEGEINFIVWLLFTNIKEVKFYWKSATVFCDILYK